MKRLIISICILAVIIITATVSLLMLNKVQQNLTKQTHDICEYLATNNLNEAYQRAQQLIEYWGNEESSLAFFFRRFQLSEITGSISRLPSLIKYGSTAEAAAECEKTTQLIRDMWEGELPLLHNIL